MNRTAWTASRDELVKALDLATREREMWRVRAEAIATKRAALRGEAAIRKQRERERRRERDTLAAASAQARLEQACAAIPPDPNAELHRRTLIAALKEKP